MLSLLADALMLATRLDPMPRRQHRSDGEWSDRFLAGRMRGDDAGGRFNARRDLNW